MKFTHNSFGRKFVYISVYSDARISSELGLGFSPAGTKKKKELLEVIGALGSVSVLSVTAGFRGVKKIGGYYAGTIQVGSKSIAIERMPWMRLPPLAIFINQFPIIYKLIRHRLLGARYIVLYNTIPEVFVPAIVAKSLMGFKLILQLEDGPNPNANVVRRSVESIFFRLAIKYSDGIVSNSTSFGLSNNDTPTMTFRGNFNNYIKAINYPRFNRDRFKIVMAGSLDAVRGLGLLVKLLESTQSYQMIKNCDFVISGPSKSQFRQELSDAISIYRSRGGSAEFRGLLDREELESEYKSADIFLSLQDPSHAFSKVSFPSKIMEYAGYRRPIVATAVSDLMNVDLFQGIVFCEYNQPALEAAILSVMDGYRDFIIDAEKISTRLEAESSLNANRIKFSRLINRIEAL